MLTDLALKRLKPKEKHTRSLTVTVCMRGFAHRPDCLPL